MLLQRCNNIMSCNYNTGTTEYHDITTFQQHDNDTILQYCNNIKNNVMLQIATAIMSGYYSIAKYNNVTFMTFAII